MVRVYSARNPWSPAAVSGSFLLRMRFTSPTQVSESSSVAARSLLLGFSMAYSTRSQSSNVRWVWCWREVISIRSRTKWAQEVGAFTSDRANLLSDTFTTAFTGWPETSRSNGLGQSGLPALPPSHYAASQRPEMAD